MLRRALFQVHMWTGVLVGLYVFVVCTTGAALVFRIDIQRALHPDLFTPGGSVDADPATILESVRDAFPGWRVSGIDAPTTLRPTYLAYVVDDRRFLTLLVDPASGRVLGELPDQTFIRTIQDLHFDLLAGRTGRTVNGIGAMLMIVLSITGAIIWWPGIANWRRGLTVDFRRSWKRVTWDLHGATGIWTVALIVMWAITGLYFAFPSQFRATVDAISPLTRVAAPQSAAASAATAERPSWRELIARARTEVPDQFVARVILPTNERAAFLVTFSPTKPTPVGPAALRNVYLDPYTGALLPESRGRGRSAGDVIIEWVVPLHVGNFGGTPVRVAWLILGLAPPLLFVTGFAMWWTRVVRPRQVAASPEGAEGAGTVSRRDR